MLSIHAVHASSRSAYSCLAIFSHPPCTMSLLSSAWRAADSVDAQ